MENSKIAWTNHTFNCWRGCSKISPGCDNCYAETMSHRNPKVLGVWGEEGTRVIASDAMWNEPLKWDQRAKEAGERHRVFCASLADVFEAREELVEPRMRLFQLIGRTPNLDWLLLTKRPQVAVENWPLWCGYWLSGNVGLGGNDDTYRTHVIPNVWVGVSVEDQERADERIPLLLRIPAKVRFLSCEPLLGPLEFSDVTKRSDAVLQLGRKALDGIGWVIAGGESGHCSRPCELDWIRSIVRQCRAANVACFVKQLGACASDPENGIAGKRLVVAEEAAPLVSLRLRDDKGGDIREWPEDLRVRQFPAVQEG